MQYHPHTVQMRIATPLGPVRLAASPAGLAGLWFEGQRHEPTAQLHGPTRWADGASHPLLQEGARQLLQYLNSERPGFVLPLDLSGGTPFQQQVWQALQDIPPGETRRYGELAANLGSHARAVARACASNPVGLLVPCHRVVGANQSLTGYRWGIERKAALLESERKKPGA